MQALKQLHDSGIEHGDLQPWNVLNHNGSLRIVDLHLAMIHPCPAKAQVMTEEFCSREAISELVCEELVSVGGRMMFRSQDQILYG
jgi:tRNA A-37 threonylcarbamoyl transferase component Bud32